MREGWKEQVTNHLQDVLRRTDTLLRTYPKYTFRGHLLQLESQTKVPAPLLFLGIAGVLLTIILALIGFAGVTLIVGVAYPTLATLKGIKNQDTGVQDFFLKYWVFFFALYQVDSLLPFLQSFFIYPAAKLVVVAWAFHPKTQGAALVYRHVRMHLLPLLGIEPALPPPAPKARKSAAGGDTYFIEVKLAAHGLKKKPEQGGEQLDTYCCLRVVNTSGRRAKGGEGQWLKTSVNTIKPVESPDWRSDVQSFVDIFTLEDTVLEVVVKNKENFKDVDLGCVRLPLKGTAPSYHGTVRLRSVDNEAEEAEGELELELAVKHHATPPAPPQT